MATLDQQGIQDVEIMRAPDPATRSPTESADPSSTAERRASSSLRVAAMEGTRLRQPGGGWLVLFSFPRFLIAQAWIGVPTATPAVWPGRP